MDQFASVVAGNLGLRTNNVEAVMALLEEGATVPFIARYRKDKTGALDEVQIQAIKDEVKAIKEFQERKATIEKSITEQGKMTDGIQSALYQAETMTELEDIYSPYKPKRKTKAQTARENGLGPLADLLLLQDGSDLEAIGQSYINEKIGSLEEALQGARDIIAEQVSEDIAVRARVRKHFENEALFQSKVAPEKEKEQETNKYKDYFDFNEPIHKIPSHRILAVLRGFLEGHLRLGINPPNEEDAIALMEDGYVKSPGSFAGEQVKKAIKDGYRRLLQPGLETEFQIGAKSKGRRGSYQRICRKRETTTAERTVGKQKVAGHRPRLQNRLQNRLSRRKRESVENEPFLPSRRRETTGRG